MKRSWRGQKVARNARSLSAWIRRTEGELDKKTSELLVFTDVLEEVPSHGVIQRVAKHYIRLLAGVNHNIGPRTENYLTMIFWSQGTSQKHCRKGIC